MNDPTLDATAHADEAALDAAIAERLRGAGWCVIDGFIDDAQIDALTKRAQDLQANGALRAAGVGRATQHHFAPQVRGDSTSWLDAANNATEQDYLQRQAALRGHLNRALFLGLTDIEAHFALYPPGARYGVHRDRFRDDDRRVVSTVCYLNRDWPADAGGQLRLYLDAERTRFHDVMPRAGRLAIFLSAEFEHEVLPAMRPRWSIAGWLRARA